MEKIYTSHTTSAISPNATATVGSTTSDLIGKAVVVSSIIHVHPDFAGSRMAIDHIMIHSHAKSYQAKVFDIEITISAQLSCANNQRIQCFQANQKLKLVDICRKLK